jgi:glycosyltransferase involved in cell wall biosynthesis
MKIIEGMSMGKSIVATPVAALGIEHKNGRDIHIRSDAAGFADCIVDLLRNPKLRNETTLFALENVRKNYNIFVAAENLIKFYSRLT